jgi:hypothetical protein
VDFHMKKRLSEPNPLDLQLSIFLYKVNNFRVPARSVPKATNL